MSDNASKTVRHNPDLRRFELDTPTGLAVADYQLMGDTMVCRGGIGPQ